MGRATRRKKSCSGTPPFQSTPSVGRATKIYPNFYSGDDISIHALRGEGDTGSASNHTYDRVFQSTPSVGRATCTLISSCFAILFQSTPSVGRATPIPRFDFLFFGYFNPRPPWGGRPLSTRNMRQPESISIHALRGEGDAKAQYKPVLRTDISIHALRGEGDRVIVDVDLWIFNFNPRPPWGGRRRSTSSSVL